MSAQQTNKFLAMAFIERAKLMGYKGKKRDEMALEFWIGAHQALCLVKGEDDPAAKALAGATAFGIALRGFEAVVRIAKDMEKV